MTPVRLEPAAPRSRVKHSTTEPLRSLNKGTCTVNPVLSSHSKWRPKFVLKTNNRLMQIKRIAECSHSNFVKLPLVNKIFVLSIFEWPLKAGFSVFLSVSHWSRYFDLSGLLIIKSLLYIEALIPPYYIPSIVGIKNCRHPHFSDSIFVTHSSSQASFEYFSLEWRGTSPQLPWGFGRLLIWKKRNSVIQSLNYDEIPMLLV